MRMALQTPPSNVGKLPSLDFIGFCLTAPRGLQQIGLLYCTWRKAVAEIGGGVRPESGRLVIGSPVLPLKSRRRRHR